MDKHDEKKTELNYEAIEADEDISSQPEIKIKKIKEELKVCRKKADEYLAGWQRAKADLINSRKDEEKNREAIIKYANEDLIYEMLSVLDSLEKALSEPALDDKWKKGLEQVRDQFMQIMRRRGVEEIKARGQKFNPAEHEGILKETLANESEDQIVLEEIQKGYKIRDKVLRPTKVKIGIYK